MAALTAALLALGTGTSFLSQQNQAQGVRRQTMAESDLMNLNAGYSDAEAQDALSRGREAVSRLRMDARATVGASRASMAAQGLDLGSGSAADVLKDTAAVSELDRLTIENNAKREAWGYHVEAAGQRYQAGNLRQAGRNAARAGRFGSGLTLLTGAMRGAEMYRTRNQ
jgi:hypothetical protein